MTPDRPRVVLLRGHQTNSWHLRPWRHLADRWDVVALVTERGWFDTSAMGIDSEPIRTLRDRLPAGAAFDQAVRVPGDRYLGLEEHLRDTAIVHSQDLGFWYSMQAARARRTGGFKLVLTCWETIPFLDAYRNVRTRPYRRLVLEQTDLFLATTERARACLLLEGAPPERIRVVAPGVDRDLFESAAAGGAAGGRAIDRHVIVSPGRLVWEKGHQDVLRALAALRRGIVDGPAEAVARARVLVIGSGPEEDRLRRYANELGIADAVEFRSEVPYREMPAIYAGASAMVLGSLPTWFWEEQYGMVLGEALCSGLPVLAADSGAIPEVTAGAAALFPAGDWLGLARALADGPLAAAPGTRRPAPAALLEAISSANAAAQLDEAYRAVLQG